MFRAIILVLFLLEVLHAQQQNQCRLKVDESNIDLHGWLRAFYSCPSLGRSFVMDNSVQRPLPSYADFVYGRSNYASILREVLGPLGLQLKQGKWVDAVVVLPLSRDRDLYAPVAPPPPLGGLAGNGGSDPVSDGDSSSVSDFLSLMDLHDIDTVESPRRLRARASGLLKSSARRMGVSYSDLLQSPPPADAVTGKMLFFSSVAGGEVSAGVGRQGRLWDISVKASDSLGSLDFARIVDFSAFEKARVVFGGETRRVDSQINFDNGNAVTQYSSIFDGLTVELSGDRWSFVWRGNGSVLEVPGSLGSCASGSSKVSYDSTVGVPLLSRIPLLKYLFSYADKYDDELLIEVCLEDLT